MRPLLRLLSARYFRRARLRAGLTLFGVALGVATLVAIDVVNGSSTATIDELVAAYAGRSALTVRAASGTLAGDALGRARAIPGVAAAAGSIRAALLVGPDLRTALPTFAGTGDEDAVREYVLARGARPPSGEVLLTRCGPGEGPCPAGAILLGEGAARRLGLDVGDSLRALTPSGLRTFPVWGILAERGLGRANAGVVAVLPFETADALYAREGRFDAIDVALAAGARADDVAARLRAAFPGASVETPEARGGQTKKLVAGLQTLLAVISALSLFIGVFLVFNTMAVAVAQRKRDLGIVRALGARQRDVVLLVATEAALLGAAASVAGVGAGLLLGRGLLALVNEQIRISFVAGLADQLVVPWPRLAALGLVGVGAAVAGALGPALAAAGAAPAEAMTAPRHLPVARPLRLRLLLVAAALAVLSVGSLGLQPDRPDATPGVLAALALMLAVAVAAAPLLALGVRGLSPAFERAFGVVARLARDSVLRSPGRAAVTAGALSAAVTMVVAMGSFIDSERRTLFDWLDQVVNADIFVSSGPLSSSSAPLPLDPKLGDDIRRIPGVRAVDLYRQVRIEFGDAFAALASVDTPIFVTRARLVFAPGTEPYDPLRLTGADEVMVSENFARRQRVRQGDTLELRTPAGPRRFRVVAIIVDYTSDQGLVFMDRATYVRHFRDTAVDSFDVMAERPDDVAAVRDALARLEGGALHVQTNPEFKAGIRRIVDDFFATTYVMQAIAFLVGVLGVANTMLVAVLERRREIGVLRAVGAARRQVARSVLLEAATIGAWGGLLGLAGGAALTAIVLAITERVSGWVIPYGYAWPTALSMLALATAAALLAAWWPARDAARTEVAQALAYE